MAWTHAGPVRLRRRLAVDGTPNLELPADGLLSFSTKVIDKPSAPPLIQVNQAVVFPHARRTRRPSHLPDPKVFVVARPDESRSSRGCSQQDRRGVAERLGCSISQTSPDVWCFQLQPVDDSVATSPCCQCAATQRSQMGDELENRPQRSMKMKTLLIVTLATALAVAACGTEVSDTTDTSLNSGSGVAGGGSTQGARTASPARPAYRDVTIPAGTTLPLALTSAIASDTSAVEDVVTAELTRAVTSDGREVLPAGTRLTGSVTEVDDSGRVKGRAMIAFRFTSLRTGDEQYDVQTAPLSHTAEATKGEDATKIGHRRRRRRGHRRYPRRGGWGREGRHCRRRRRNRSRARDEGQGSAARTWRQCHDGAHGAPHGACPRELMRDASPIERGVLRPNLFLGLRCLSGVLIRGESGVGKELVACSMLNSVLLQRLLGSARS